MKTANIVGLMMLIVAVAGFVQLDQSSRLPAGTLSGDGFGFG